MARSRVVIPKSITDAWDQSLFHRAVKKVKSKQQVFTQTAGEVVIKTQASSLLPVTNNLKLLAPLAGVFTALLLTSGWQVAAGEWQLPASIVSLQQRLTQVSATGYAKLGVMGQAGVSELPLVKNYLLGAANATGGNVTKTFKLSLTSFKSGSDQLWINLKSAGTELGNVLGRVVIVLKDFFERSLSDAYVNLLSGIGFMSDRVEVVIDGWLTPVSLEAKSGIRTLAAVPVVMGDGLAVVKENLTWGGEQIIKWWQGVIDNWQKFWVSLGARFNRPTKNSAVFPADTDDETKNDIQEIKQDVKSVLRLLNRQELSASPNKQGMIVAPSSGTAAGDAALKNDIAARFSDPVNVKLDGSGKAGVITPVFSATGEGDYLFLLTPVKQ